MSFDREALFAAHGPGTRDEGEHWLVAADWFLSRGERELAASALDRAYGLLPDNADVARQRAGLLTELAIEEHGLVFRYVPAGTFSMGSSAGDSDERPVHARRLDAFWIAEVPMTWSAYCALAGWSQPPEAWPPEGDPSLAGDRTRQFNLHELNKIRLQYCESETTAAGDWHAHTRDPRFGTPPRAHPERAIAYDQKPMIATSPFDAEAVGARMSDEATIVRLPSEAEWEKAARGGLVGARWSWGNTLPTRGVCDFDRFGAFHLVDPRSLPPNGYGLHGMCGGVAEWTADRYDALAYHHFTKGAPFEEPAPTDARVLRGGSWSDCADAVTVSFRMSRTASDWRNSSPESSNAIAANVGFRLVRVPRSSGFITR
jgi:sulfatase modifying factor 1